MSPPTLPPELLSAIIENISDQHTLFQCALISCAWYAATLPYLYATPNLVADNLLLFASSLSQTTHGALVHKLDFTGPNIPHLIDEHHLIDDALTRYTPNLHTLCLASSVSISPQGLVSALSSCSKSLRSLTLFKCLNLTRHSIHFIAESCPNLYCLNIWGLTHRGMVPSPLPAIATGCPLLQTLILSHCVHWVDDETVVKDVCSLRALTRLDISMCPQVSDVALVAIGEKLQRLESVAINGMRNLTDVGFMALARGCPRIKRLDMTGVQVRLETVKAIGECLTHLEKLDIRFTEGITTDVMVGVMPSKVEVEASEPEEED
ncbi:hypothetical protein BC936DRAFT_139091 [Jimgerdemannia flammicorona]|uniref:Uncharacterized protein n=2 Tax=Jimgerdemannia flammicorona TaxID=994334 RepID=A0A433DI08_9FUNG|nr:hypothetical protein BC936DRAFT_139091 [Jimgerdemannia flammicorona]RUS33398.1 hypothetical protein BC938DRAFT_471889 [Jimgerdemannia flammicorona]